LIIKIHTEEFKSIIINGAVALVAFFITIKMFDIIKEAVLEDPLVEKSQLMYDAFSLMQSLLNIGSVILLSVIVLTVMVMIIKGNDDKYRI